MQKFPRYGTLKCESRHSELQHVSANDLNYSSHAFYGLWCSIDTLRTFAP